MKHVLSVAAAALLLSCAPALAAPLETFLLTWAPVGSGTASATGSITLDPTLLPNPGATAGSFLTNYIDSLSITVTGADFGNGTFTLSDFGAASWDTGGNTVDFSSNLIGQIADLNFTAVAPSTTPTAVGLLQMQISDGQVVKLVSVLPAEAAPEPVSLAVLGVGLLGLSVLRRRRAG